MKNLFIINENDGDQFINFAVDLNSITSIQLKQYIPKATSFEEALDSYLGNEYTQPLSKIFITLSNDRTKVIKFNNATLAKNIYDNILKKLNDK